MAKKRKPVQKARKSKSVKPSYFTQSGKERRDNKGRFLSKEAWSARKKEIKSRLSDKYERAQEKARQQEEARKWHKRERAKKTKRTRNTRTGRLKSIYANESNAGKRLARDSAVLDGGGIPKSHDVRKVGSHYLHYWVYFGNGAVQAVESFLLNARQYFPRGTLGRVAIGTSYSKKNGVWVGTATLPLQSTFTKQKNLLQAYFILLERDSGQNVFGEDGEEEVWAEIELLLRERTI